MRILALLLSYAFLSFTLIKSQTYVYEDYNAYEIITIVESKLDAANPAINTNEIIILLDNACSNRLFIDKNEKFGEVINRSERFYLLDKIVNKINNPILKIVYSKYQFITLVLSQFQLKQSFDQLEPKDKFTSSIVLNTALKDMSLKKTQLLQEMITLLADNRFPDQRENLWTTIGRMLIEIDLKESETGNKKIQYSPYGIVVQKEKTIPALELIKINESDTDVALLAGRIIDNIFISGRKYVEKPEEPIVLTPEEFGNVNNSDYKSALVYYNSALNEEDPDKKIKLYSLAIMQNSRLTEAFINRGVLYFQKEKYDSAFIDFQNADRLVPNSADVLVYLGMSKQKLKYFQEAKNYFTKALLINSNYDLAFLNLGICYQELKDYENALYNYKKAIKFDSTNVTALVNAGICNQKLGQDNLALELLTKAEKILPDNQYVLYNLGSIYWENKKWEQVINYWNKLNPEFAVKFKIANKLKKAKEYLSLSKK